MGRDKGVYQEEDVLTTPTPTSSTTETTNSRSLTSTVYEPLTYQVPESIATRIVFSPPFGAPASSTSVVVNQASAVFRPPAQAIPQAIANRVIFKGAAKGDSAAKGAKSGAEADSADMTKTQASGLGQRKSPTATEP